MISLQPSSQIFSSLCTMILTWYNERIWWSMHYKFKKMNQEYCIVGMFLVQTRKLIRRKRIFPWTAFYFNLERWRQQDYCTIWKRCHSHSLTIINLPWFIFHFYVMFYDDSSAFLIASSMASLNVFSGNSSPAGSSSLSAMLMAKIFPLSE